MSEKLLGKFLGRYPVYESQDVNKCRAEFEGTNGRFEYYVRSPSCFTRCYYIDIPLYVVLVGTVGDVNIWRYVQKIEAKRIALLVARYALKIRRIDKEDGRFLLDRAYQLYTMQFDPTADTYDMKRVVKMNQIVASTSIPEVIPRYC